VGAGSGLCRRSCPRRVRFVLLAGLLASSCGVATATEVAAADLSELSIDELLNVRVVSASKRAEPIVEAPATMMTITAADIRNRGYETLEDVLADLPGFDFVHVQGTWPTIWAQRGAYGDENKRTLVMIDGIVENNILEGSVLGGAQYSVHGVERIEVVWGPGSALYGANAFGGIVNVITKRGKDAPGVEYRQSYGADETVSEKLCLGGSLGGLDYSLSGSLHSTDGPVFSERHPGYTNSYVDEAYSLVGRLDWEGWTLGFHRFDRPMGDGQFSNSPAVAAYGLSPYGWEGQEGTDGGWLRPTGTGSTGASGHSFTETTFLRKEASLGPTTSLTGTLYYRRTGIADDSFEYDWRDGAFHRDPYQHDSDLWGTEIKVDQSLSESQDLTAGIQVERSDVERGYRGTVAIDDLSSALLDDSFRVSDVYRNAAAYGQYRWRTDFLGTTLVAGIRYDRSNVFGGSLNPRIALVSRLDDATTIKLLSGRAFRAPKQLRALHRDAGPRRESGSRAGTRDDLRDRPDPPAHREARRRRESLLQRARLDDRLERPDRRRRRRRDREHAEPEPGTRHGPRLRAPDDRRRLDSRPAPREPDDPGRRSGRCRRALRHPEHREREGEPRDRLGRSRDGERLPLGQPGRRPDDGPHEPEAERRRVRRHEPLRRVEAIPPRPSERGLRISNLFDTDYEDPGIRTASGGYYGTRHLQPGRSALARLSVSF